MKFLFSTIFIALTASPTYALKFLILNDIHLDVNGTAYIPMPGSETTYGLLDEMIQDMKTEESNSGISIDAIFIPGDFCRHGLASKSQIAGSGDPNWPL